MQVQEERAAVLAEQHRNIERLLVAVSSSLNQDLPSRLQEVGKECKSLDQQQKCLLRCQAANAGTSPCFFGAHVLCVRIAAVHQQRGILFQTKFCCYFLQVGGLPSLLQVVRAELTSLGPSMSASVAPAVQEAVKAALPQVSCHNLH